MRLRTRLFLLSDCRPTSIPSRSNVAPSTIGRPCKVEDRGIELPPKSSGNTGVSAAGGAKSGAVDARSGAIDPGLAAVVEAWPGLPEAARQAILAIVRQGHPT